MLTETALPVVASFGLELWGVELLGASRPVARLYVDSPASPDGVGCRADAAAAAIADVFPDGASPEAAGGVSVDQCAEISRLVGLALDVEDAFPDAWVLEVSSPGLERSFFDPHQLPPYRGRELDVTLWEPHPDFPGRRKFRGRLVRVEGDAITLRPEAAAGPQDMVFRWNEARRVRLIHIFPDTSRPGSGKTSRSDRHAGALTGQGGGNKA